MKAHEMKDWNPTLRLNAASCQLARDIYKARCDAYGIAFHDPFEDLPPRLRQRYIEQAVSILKFTKPMPRDIFVHWHKPCRPIEFPAGDSFTADRTKVTCRECHAMLARWEAQAKQA